MPTPSNKSIIKAFNLVEVVCAAPEGLSLREVAVAAHLPVATTHRLLSTLRSVGALCADENGIYTLGPRVLALHDRNTEAEQAVHAVLEAHLAGLLCRPATSVRLSVLTSKEIYILAGVDNGVDPRMRSKIGAHYEAYCTAPGKVLLAALSARKQDDYVFGSGFVGMTPNTIVIPSQLAEEIKRVQAAGYALDNGEFLDGVRCLSVPVATVDGTVIAALSIAGQASAVQDIPHLVPELTASARKLAQKLTAIPGWFRVLHRSAPRLAGREISSSNLDR